jgi:hypothetical protein
MKMTLKHAAALLPLLAACYATAADDAAAKPAAPQLPVIFVQAVTTDDPSGYATWVAKGNEDFKSGGGPEHFTRVFQGAIAGDDTGKVFAVRVGESAEALVKASETLMKVPEERDLLGHLNAIRKLGSSHMLKAIYFEGGYAGEWVFITCSNVKDSAGYLKALQDVRPMFDSHGLKDIKINYYKVISGRSDHSHEVIISAPTQERCAAALDALSEPWLADWVAGLNNVRTVVSNGTYHEISK